MSASDCSLWLDPTQSAKFPLRREIESPFKDMLFGGGGRCNARHRRFASWSGLLDAKIPWRSDDQARWPGASPDSRARPNGGTRKTPLIGVRPDHAPRYGRLAREAPAAQQHRFRDQAVPSRQPRNPKKPGRQPHGRSEGSEFDPVVNSLARPPPIRPSMKRRPSVEACRCGHRAQVRPARSPRKGKERAGATLR